MASIFDPIFGDEAKSEAQQSQEKFIFDTFDVGGAQAIGNGGAKVGDWEMDLKLPQLPGINFGNGYNNSDGEKKDEQGKSIAEAAGSGQGDSGSQLQLPTLQQLSLPTLKDLRLPTLKDLRLPNAMPNISVPELDIIDLPTIQAPDITKPIEAVAKAAEPVLESAGDIMQHIAEGAKPVADVVSAVAQPVGQAIQDTINGVGKALGEPAQAIADGAMILQGDGTGYGQIKIGDTGAVLDISHKIDDALSSFTKGTPLEKIPGSDIFHLATDPSKFIEQKGEDAARDTLTKLTGNSSVAGGIVDGLATAIKTGDVGKAAESAAKGAVSHAIVDTVSGAANAIIPGSGFVIQAIAAIFHYGCYLSTAAYYHGLLSESEFLSFTRYRMTIQSREFLSQATWLGYIVGFGWMFGYLLKSKSRTELVYKWVLLPWLNHINYLNGESWFTWRGWLTVQALRVYCLAAFVVCWPFSLYLWWKLRNFNAMDSYRAIIKEVRLQRSMYGQAA